MIYLPAALTTGGGVCAAMAVVSLALHPPVVSLAVTQGLTSPLVGVADYFCL